MSNLLETLLEESFAILSAVRNSVPRQYQFPQADNIIKVAIGMRRSGKTYFLYQTINALLDQGILKEQVLFINFEDDRLSPMNAKTMGALLDEFYSLYPENHQRRCYIFLDEIQNVEDWHLTVRRYFDKKNVALYLSGSSAKLLSTEINTNLRGRSLAIEILPFSFTEYLTAHGVKSTEGPFGQAAFDQRKQQLLQYLSVGGFPAVQNMPPFEWREMLQNYIDVTILRDIIERYDVSNINLLKYLTTTLLKNTAAPFSINKFYNDTKSQGYKVGKDTVHAYLRYLQDAFLIFVIPFYSTSEREKETRPKKIYAIDFGLINAVGVNPEESYGKLFENLVYLDLRRQHKTVYFYQTKEGYEIDFVSVDPAGKKELIQVAYEITDPKTLEREKRALLSAEEELGIPGRILTVMEYLRELKF